MIDRLSALFPGLQASPFRVTSPADPNYNCIAWAAGSTADWWWPLDDVRRYFWPAGVSREISLPAFAAAFGALGYAICSDDSFEPGFEKVAIFADAVGTPTHAARQLPTGRWTSKLGQREDIEHDLRALEGDIYGRVVMMLQRPRT